MDRTPFVWSFPLKLPISRSVLHIDRYLVQICRSFSWPSPSLYRPVVSNIHPTTLTFSENMPLCLCSRSDPVIRLIDNVDIQWEYAIMPLFKTWLSISSIVYRPSSSSFSYQFSRFCIGMHHRHFSVSCCPVVFSLTSCISIYCIYIFICSLLSPSPSSRCPVVLSLTIVLFCHIVEFSIEVIGSYLVHGNLVHSAARVVSSV
jgi:hypothetical protein